MDETYISTTVAGIRFYYQIRLDVVSGKSAVTFSYGSYKAPPEEKIRIQFSSELRTYSTDEDANLAIRGLQQYVNS